MEVHNLRGFHAETDSSFYGMSQRTTAKSTQHTMPPTDDDLEKSKAFQVAPGMEYGVWRSLVLSLLFSLPSTSRVTKWP